MARARSAAAADVKKTGKGRRGLAFAWVCALVGGVALVAAMPVVALFVGAGMAPTLAAALIDRDPDKYAAVSVGALNLAGLAPYVVRLFAYPGAAHAMLSDIYVWLVIYSAAAVGWGFYAGFPVVAMRLADLRAEWRVRDLKRRQEQLVEEWGPEVADPDKAQRS